MKSKRFAFLGLFALGLTLLSGPFALAVSSGAQTVRVKFATTNVTASAYRELVHATTRGISGVSVINTGSAPVQLAFGPAGSEVVQSSHYASSSMPAVVYPLQAGYSTRISVISLDQTNSTGELEVNFFYN